MHIYFGGFFALVAFITLLLLLWSGYRGYIANVPAYMGGAWLAIFLTALISPAPSTPGYKGAILFCLLVLGLALAFDRVIPGPRVVAVGFMMIGLGVLFFAFSDDTAFRLPTPLVLVAPLLGALTYWRVLPGPAASPTPRDLRGDLIVLLVLLVMSTWQAIERWAQLGTVWALLAMLGMLVLWSVLILHRAQMRAERRAAATVIATVAPTPTPTVAPAPPPPPPIEALPDATPVASAVAPVAPESPEPVPLVPPPGAPYTAYILVGALAAGWLLALSVWTVFELG
ncbi:MAG: hypothetical protein WDZ49_13095 [Litorilinea sp.]